MLTGDAYGRNLAESSQAYAHGSISSYRQKDFRIRIQEEKQRHSSNIWDRQ
jgi:hypothetical protein